MLLFALHHELDFQLEVSFKTVYHRRWVHLECDKPTDHELDSQLKEEYVCTYCRHLAAEMDALQTGSGVEMADITAGTRGPAAANRLLEL